jgi:hypothetical protein
MGHTCGVVGNVSRSLVISYENAFFPSGRIPQVLRKDLASCAALLPFSMRGPGGRGVVQAGIS